MGIDAALTVRAPTSPGRFYEFRKLSGGAGVNVRTGSVGCDVTSDYHTFYAGTRAASAACYLVERCAELEKFFQAARKLSITEINSGRFEGFIDNDLCEDDDNPDGGMTSEEAWEVVATMIEEADAANWKPHWG